ncbi:GMC family oxidoreductase [Parapedobacter sp. 10938]|uniref:GMC family oxidoreductase n=1 Tax=Parapedobacter flavus TaxID=3110225 RepID=UPI002DBA6144|nr:GMC family oxidoreductase [Parapedobacter sp. 10938]MEC3879890.1 GMC family oxidoreductase [Parapedobacter sp. 10938]
MLNTTKNTVTPLSSTKRHTYDAIVIGSGISGGWAAKELCEKGLKTLVLERGRDVRHPVDYPTAMLNPWDFQFRLKNTMDDVRRSPIQSGGFDESTKHFYVADDEHPYHQVKPFSWFRGYQVGGRSLIWGRQCYRLSDLDFEANSRDGHGVDWPIRYADLSPWYDYVESFVGISGKAENLPQLPDGIFLPPMELNCVEDYLADHIRKMGRILTAARVANLTKGWKGRGPCQYRNLCARGCPYGGYFSSNSATIPAAFATGNLTLRPFSVVSELIFDDNTQRVSGVRVVDTQTLEETEFYARVVFVNASTINTTALLLASKSNRFPNGLGNDSGQLGRNLMDHHSSAGAEGTYDGFRDHFYKGRRPCGFLIPRYRNLDGNSSAGFLRGYQVQGVGSREGWQERKGESGFGTGYKQRLLTPGDWKVWLGGWGECLPNPNNRITLDESQPDKWGMPRVVIDFEFGENEQAMQSDTRSSCAEMLEYAGFRNIHEFNYAKPGGSTVHEMGTARMGSDPRTSVLNKFNQLHAVDNVFITDGSAMTSSACQNPSLTYMALTARACNYAVDELRAGRL